MLGAGGYSLPRVGVGTGWKHPRPEGLWTAGLSEGSTGQSVYDAVALPFWAEHLGVSRRGGGGREGL